MHAIVFVIVIVGGKKTQKAVIHLMNDGSAFTSPTVFVLKNVAALESQPLLGFVLKEDSTQKLQFKLYHKNTIFYIFKADDVPAAQR